MPPMMMSPMMMPPMMGVPVAAAAVAAAAPTPPEPEDEATKARKKLEQEQMLKAVPQTGAVKVVDQSSLAPVIEKKIQYGSKDDAYSAFTQLLHEKLDSTYTWQSAMPKIVVDKRYGAVKSLSKRKELFEAFRTEAVAKAKEEEEARRAERKAAFEAMLDELVQAGDLNGETRFRDLERSLEKDQRFSSVPDRHERRDMFEAFVGELRKREEVEREERAKVLVALLEQKPELTHLTRPREAIELVEDMDEFKAIGARRYAQRAVADYIHRLQQEHEVSPPPVCRSLCLGVE